MLNAPTSFNAANDWLKSRVNIPTAKGSRELALSPEFGGAVKMHSFFSAKVAEARTLKALRDISDRYSLGKMNLADARAEAKAFLGGVGYSPDDVSGEDDSTGGSKAVGNLASKARLDLIFQQNAAMARAVADRQVSMDPDIMERFPYLRYVQSTANDPRLEHAKFAGLIFHKSDPFWLTHTGPWDWGCQCGTEDVSLEDALAAGVSEAKPYENGMDWGVNTPDGRRLTVPAPESGYSFNVAEALKALDMSRIEDLDARREVFDSVKDYASSGANMDFKLTPGDGPLQAPALEDGAKPEAISSFLKSALAKAPDAKESSISLGSLSGGLIDGLGMPPGELRLSAGSGEYGVAHNAKHHLPEMLDGRFLEILQRTLWNAGAGSFMQFTGGKVYMAFYDPATKAYVLALKVGPGWRTWELVSAQKANAKYAAGKSVMK